MKKKGLIISTVVMVIVLIASLTTATYAWFTTGSAVSVNDITMSVGAGSDVAIGASRTNAYKADATMDDFVNGSLTWDGSSVDAKWKGDDGLSTSLNTNVSAMVVSKAVSTATKATEGEGADQKTVYTADTKWNDATGHEVIKASGNAQTITQNTVDPAVANMKDATNAGDYFSLAMGVQTATSNLKYIGCVITIDPNTDDGKTTLGMNAAIHVAYKLNGAADWTDIDVYNDTDNSKAAHYSTAKTAVTNRNAGVVTGTDGTTVVTYNPGAQSIKIDIAGSDSNTTALTEGAINQLELIIYIAGYDTDCNNAAMGIKSTIHINIVTTKLNA